MCLHQLGLFGPCLSLAPVRVGKVPACGAGDKWATAVLLAFTICDIVCSIVCASGLVYTMLRKPCCAMLQDLSKVKLWQKNSSSRSSVSAGPISIGRSLPDPVSCPLEEWAPDGGPVRPLLQVWGGFRQVS